MDNVYAIRPFMADDEPAIIALWDVVFPDEAAWNNPADVIARKRRVQPELFIVAKAWQASSCAQQKVG